MMIANKLGGKMTTLPRGIKFEITKQLSLQTQETFAQWIGCYGVIWNCKVAENKTQYQDFLVAKALDETVVPYKANQKVAHFITAERPWLQQIPSQIRRNAGTKYVEALRACIKGLRKAPTFKNKYAKKNCLVTNELFEPIITTDTLEFAFKRSQKSKAFCKITVPKPVKMAGVPKMVWLTRRGARYWLSWSYEQNVPTIRAEHTLLEQLQQSPAALQEARVLGIDMGIKEPICLSTGEALHFTPEELKAIQRKAARRLRYQKKLSRQQRQNQERGKNYQKVKAKLADKHAQIANIRKNMAHRASKILAETATEVIVCEKLAIRNMTKRPKAKQDPKTQQWLRNGASAKAALNKSILEVGWGRLQNYLDYKLRERDKLLVKISPKHSSQECFACGHIASENRKTQAVFHCLQCHHCDNADINAAKVLKKRFITSLNAGKFVLPTKTVKKIAVRKQKAARMAVSVCGADLRPVSIGSGNEAETFKNDLRSLPL